MHNPGQKIPVRFTCSYKLILCRCVASFEEDSNGTVMSASFFLTQISFLSSVEEIAISFLAVVVCFVWFSYISVSNSVAIYMWNNKRIVRYGRFAPTVLFQYMFIFFFLLRDSYFCLVSVWLFSVYILFWLPWERWWRNSVNEWIFWCVSKS